MNACAFSRRTVSAIAFAIVAGMTTPATAFLDFLKKAEKKAPSATEKQVQEAAASAMLRDAKSAEAAGSSGKASSIFSQIIKQYPFTDSAAEAAFSKAMIVRQSGQLQDAFDAFQAFIDSHRQSPRFSDAIQQQYEIAEEAKGGKKQKNFLVIPMKLGSTEVIELYQKVIRNAPYGKFAPMAQFSIAEIHQENNDKPAAIAAYQGVVDNYPSSPQASEAQFRIGSISNVAAMKSEDQGNLVAARDALNTYVAANPAGDRAGEAQAMLQQVSAAEAEDSLKIARFYEQQGKPKAAAIYYNEALKYGSSEASNEARAKLAELARNYPQDMADMKMAEAADYTVPAAVDLRNRDDYVGPPAPELAKLSQKPKMRADDGFVPIPLQEPKLPMREGATGQPVPGTLLPPVADPSKPMLLPVPPAPGAGPSLLEVPKPPVPPAPATPEKPAAPAPEAPAPPAEKKP